MGPHLTQCGQGRGLPACQVSSWSVQPFGHSARTSNTGQDRQRTDSIGRTVLQTVAQKSNEFFHSYDHKCTAAFFMNHSVLYIRPSLSPHKIAPSRGGSEVWTSSNAWFLGPTWVLNPNGTLIGSAVFTGLTTVTVRQTDRSTDHATRSVTRGSIYVCSIAMRPNMGHVTLTTPFLGEFVTLTIKIYTAYPITKPDNSSFICSSDMIGDPKIQNGSDDPDHTPFGGSLSSFRLD